MLNKIIVIVAGLVIGALIIFGLLYGYGYYEIQTTKHKIDDLVKNNIPATAYSQHEFSKERVDSMMKACVIPKYREFKDQEAELQQAVQYCGCIINKRALGFTLLEYYTAGNAHWDPKLAPEATRKNTQMEVECSHSLYK